MIEDPRIANPYKITLTLQEAFVTLGNLLHGEHKNVQVAALVYHKYHEDIGFPNTELVFHDHGVANAVIAALPPLNHPPDPRIHLVSIHESPRRPYSILTMSGYDYIHARVALKEYPLTLKVLTNQTKTSDDNMYIFTFARDQHVHAAHIYAALPKTQE